MSCAQAHKDFSRPVNQWVGSNELLANICVLRPGTAWPRENAMPRPSVSALAGIPSLHGTHSRLEQLPREGILPFHVKRWVLSTMSLVVAPLHGKDRLAWQALARGYKEFYATPTSETEYATAWRRLLERDGVHGLGASIDGELIGIAHYLFHPTVWAGSSCYLQDLFTLPSARNNGVARSLIEAVAAEARAKGAARYYWHTQEHNAVGRVLYNKVARHAGFIRYDFALQPPGA